MLEYLNSGPSISGAILSGSIMVAALASGSAVILDSLATSRRKRRAAARADTGGYLKGADRSRPLPGMYSAPTPLQRARAAARSYSDSRPPYNTYTAHFRIGAEQFALAFEVMADTPRLARDLANVFLQYEIHGGRVPAGTYCVGIRDGSRFVA